MDYVLLTEGEAVIVHDMEKNPEIAREFHAQLIANLKVE